MGRYLRSGLKEELVAHSVLVVVLTIAVIMCGRNIHESNWILRDGVLTTAHVTGVGSHNCVYYTYSVAGTHYSGYGTREYRDPRYASVGTGGQTVLWYSASHPWISSPLRPRAMYDGSPFVIIASALDLLFVACLISDVREVFTKQQRAH